MRKSAGTEPGPVGAIGPTVWQSCMYRYVRAGHVAGRCPVRLVPSAPPRGPIGATFGPEMKKVAHRGRLSETVQERRTLT